MASVRVGAFQSRAEAHAATGFLRGHGVRARVVADDDHGLDPAVAFGTSRVSILVPQKHASRARRLLDEKEPAGDFGHTRRREILGAVLFTTTVAAIVFAFAYYVTA